ncbi:phage portal protein [Ruminococcus sp. Marseille-P6503]|uniref:phage portal protein n=1 Tax=Ruminococcus sp. Marseille-P6503 TaxID=2364796 RepID=UPI000F5387A0|nr:phage portal protein [Ruminococcus sp. Marseille-P6503]
MNIFRKKAPSPSGRLSCSAQREVYRLCPSWNSFETQFYENLRAEVPVLDACIGKIIRLCNDFKVVCGDKQAQKHMDGFALNVAAGISGRSLSCFADMWLDTLLTYGKALGEIVIDPRRRRINGLYIADPVMFGVRGGKDPLDMRIIENASGDEVKLTRPELLLYSTLNPSVKHPEGVSILRGTPALSEVLMKIYRCIGQNFDRAGNVRYAVTYKPSDDPADRAFAKDRALEIAREWSDGMSSARNGVIKDFVAVGDVQIKVIGADSQIIDTEIPVRQLLEQIISKLSIPPFLLGLNWSTTERMSSQQADILTSELEYYRRLLTPVLLKTAETFLRLSGFGCGCEIQWENINLQDETELARANYYNALAEAGRFGADAADDLI